MPIAYWASLAILAGGMGTLYALENPPLKSTKKLVVEDDYTTKELVA